MIAPGPRYAVMSCCGCGAPIADPKNPRKRFCSLACFARSRRVADIRCATCGAEVHKTLASPGRRRKFCGIPCYSLSRKVGPATLTCEWCRKTVTKDGREGNELRRRGRRFCSLPCANAAHGSRDRERWEGESRRRLYASTRVRSTDGHPPHA